MRLAAMAVGVGVPDNDFAGTVEHVFPQVCLLELSDRTLVTLATAAVGHLPRGITLHSARELLLAGYLTAGAAFAARGAMLRFSASSFCVDLRGSHRWQCDLASLGLDIDNPPVAKAWRAARAALRRDGRINGLQRLAGATIDKLIAATRCFAAPAAGKALSALVGLGEGTTPAGDDFLVGYLAGLWSSVGVIEARTCFLATLAEQLTAAASRTHRVSRVYLEAVADGQISERLHAVAVGIAAGADEETIAAAMQSALAVGHSSGACAILGLLAGTATWSAAAIDHILPR